ncbi:hypothetical protein B9Z55_022624 [Caenorhabditis nigoni]|uniref:Dihydroprymidine dehydrogenase domain-containing protein n=1 Tax=Caenorhabditis nigoni TaxID=1611254 RepID=A0A2G5SLN6_9PELO|nr:hypothetical protein B9Z55_022624 [Caenorhabditis nigoni]
MVVLGVIGRYVDAAMRSGYAQEGTFLRLNAATLDLDDANIEDLLFVKFKIEEFVKLTGSELVSSRKREKKTKPTAYPYTFNGLANRINYPSAEQEEGDVEKKSHLGDNRKQRRLSRGAEFENEEHLHETADQENDKKSKPDPEERLNDWDDFLELTGRVCPAPCEEACTLGIGSPAFCIKSIECAIIDYAFVQEWIKPAINTSNAIMGSGPSLLRAAAQLVKIRNLNYEVQEICRWPTNQASGARMRQIPD